MKGLLLSEFRSLKVRPLVFLLPLEEKLDMMLHLKGLSYAIEALVTIFIRDFVGSGAMAPPLFLEFTM